MTALAGPKKPAGENPQPSVDSRAARRRKQPSGVRALGRRYGGWRPAQNRCSYRGRAGLPSALCPSGAHIRAKETYLAQLCIFGSLPQQACQSTTLDNGSENYLHTKLQEELGIRTYFAHPYCSWQRGTNEYTNGLLRRYFPKRTDFRYVTQEQLNDVVHRLNNTPRKVFQYHTPGEVFSERLSQLVEAAGCGFTPYTVVNRLMGVVSFFVRPQSPFLRPGPLCSDADARSGCQGWPSLRPCQIH